MGLADSYLLYIRKETHKWSAAVIWHFLFNPSILLYHPFKDRDAALHSSFSCCEAFLGDVHKLGITFHTRLFHLVHQTRTHTDSSVAT